MELKFNVVFFETLRSLERINTKKFYQLPTKCTSKRVWERNST